MEGRGFDGAVLVVDVGLSVNRESRGHVCSVRDVVTPER